MERTSVLLIDDDPDMATIAGRVIEKAGFRFLWAKSAEEGLATIVDKSPDVVLLDHMLPDMNGLEFLRTLRQDPDYSACQDVPVMMLTAYEGKHSDIEEMFRLGLTAYLQKPFGHRELVNIIWNVSERRRVQRAQRRQRNGSNGITELRGVAETLRGLADSERFQAGADEEEKSLVQQLLKLTRQLLRKLESGQRHATSEAASVKKS
jgi:DNA-binding response OmpR family regulator